MIKKLTAVLTIIICCSAFAEDEEGNYAVTYRNCIHSDPTWGEIRYDILSAVGNEGHYAVVINDIDIFDNSTVFLTYGWSSIVGWELSNWNITVDYVELNVRMRDKFDSRASFYIHGPSGYKFYIGDYVFCPNEQDDFTFDVQVDECPISKVGKFAFAFTTFYSDVIGGMRDADIDSYAFVGSNIYCSESSWTLCGKLGAGAFAFSRLNIHGTENFCFDFSKVKNWGDLGQGYHDAGVLESVFIDASRDLCLSVKLPTDATVIPPGMFASLRVTNSDQQKVEVELPETLEYLGCGAFNSCNGIKELDFSGCLKMQTLGCGQYNKYSKNAYDGWGVKRKYEGDYNGEQALSAFDDSSIETIKLPPDLREIPWATFRRCKQLKEIVVPKGVKSIESDAFRGCTNLMCCEFEASPAVSSIGYAAFEGCAELRAINLPEGVTSIGDYAFSGCSGVTSIIIPTTVTTIGKYAFQNCSDAKAIIIPEGVSSIGDSAFYGCKSAMNITVPKSVISWGSNVFYGCTGWRRPVVNIVSVGFREDDPTILDIVYNVEALTPMVKVRVLAFKDGERYPGNLIRPETFVDGTASSIGDGVKAGENHTISWKVSADWDVKIAKLAIDVMATGDDLLPWSLITIPGTPSHPETLEVSLSTLSDDSLINALYWLYADKHPGLTLADGVFRSGSNTLAYTSIDKYNRKTVSIAGYAAHEFVYSAIGYKILKEDLDYVRKATRKQLKDSSQSQYAVRVLESAK